MQTNASSPTQDPLSVIPEPDAVRERLAQNLREARLLRSMLRLSDRVSIERRRRAPPAHLAGHGGAYA
jgi:hypothetical protein